jgi:hypothetical protein
MFGISFFGIVIPENFLNGAKKKRPVLTKDSFFTPPPPKKKNLPLYYRQIYWQLHCLKNVFKNQCCVARTGPGTGASFS